MQDGQKQSQGISRRQDMPVEESSFLQVAEDDFKRRNQKEGSSCDEQHGSVTPPGVGGPFSAQQARESKDGQSSRYRNRNQDPAGGVNRSGNGSIIRRVERERPKPRVIEDVEKKRHSSVIRPGRKIVRGRITTEPP
jgi:hypothetical protein